MRTVELSATSSGMHLAKINLPVIPQEDSSAQEKSHAKLSPINTLRQIAKDTAEINRYQPTPDGPPEAHFAHARLAFSRLLASLRRPSINKPGFRGYQQIEVELTGHTLPEAVHYRPKPVPDVIKIFENKLVEWKLVRAHRQIPVELQESWETLRRSEAQRWQRAIDLHAFGFSLSEIRQELVKEFGDGRGNIQGWTRGTDVPWMFKHIIKQPARLRTCNQEMFASPEFSYLLGVLSTVSKSNRSTATVTTQDLDLIARVRECAEKIIGELPPVRQVTEPSGVVSHKVNVQSLELKSIVWHASAGQTVVPWQYLDSPEHERNFVRAILDFNSGITFKRVGNKTYPLVELTFTGREQFVDEIQLLFARHSITGSISYDSETRVSRIEFSGPETIDAIITIGFSCARKADRLNLEVERSARKARDYTVAEYNEVVGLLAESVPVRQIARITGVSRDAVNSWKEGSKPDLVKRAERIQAIAERNVSPEIIRDLILNKKFDPLTARQPEGQRGRADTPQEQGGHGVAKDLPTQRKPADFRMSDISQLDDIIARHPVLSPAAQRDLVNRKARDPVAREKLIYHNLRIVIRTVNKYAPSDRKHDPDLILSGVAALVRAVDGFNSGKISVNTGKLVKFSSYAFRAVERQIWKDLVSYRGYSMSIGQYRNIRRLNNAEKVLKSLGEDPTLENLMTESGLTRATLIATMNLRKIAITGSIDAPISADDDTSRAGNIADSKPAVHLTRATELEELGRVAGRALDALEFGKRDQEILLMRIGLKSAELEAVQLKEIAAHFGLSTERISQILERAFEKIRDNLQVKAVRELIVHLES